MQIIRKAEHVIEKWAKPLERDAPAPTSAVKPQQLDMFERAERASPNRDASRPLPIPTATWQAEPPLPAAPSPEVAKPKGRFDGLRLQVDRPPTAPVVARFEGLKRPSGKIDHAPNLDDALDRAVRRYGRFTLTIYLIR